MKFAEVVADRDHTRKRPPADTTLKRPKPKRRRGYCRACGKHPSSALVQVQLRDLKPDTRAAGSTRTAESWSVCDDCADSIYSALRGALRRMKGLAE